MAGIKAKISNLLHKDKDTTHNDGVGHDKHSTTGTGIGGTSTGHAGHTSTTGGVGDARSGMDDMDINRTTGAGVGGVGGVGRESATGRTSETGLGSTSTMGTTGMGHTSTMGTTGTTGMGTTSTTGTTGMGTTGMGTTTGDVSQGVTRGYDSATNEIIDQERFTKTEDHEVIIEKKAYELEHRPVEKKYVVETKYMGERTVPGRPTELLSTDAREVEERVVEMPRGDRTIVVENVDVPVGMESAGRAINEHSTTGATGLTSGQTSGLTSGQTTGLGHDNLGGTGVGGTGTGLGTSGTGVGGTGTGLGGTGTGLGSDSTRM